METSWKHYGNNMETKLVFDWSKVEQNLVVNRFVRFYSIRSKTDHTISL